MIPIELRGSTFTYYELADGSGLAVKDRYHLREVVAELYWFDRQGTISRREEVARGGKIAAITPRAWRLAAGGRLSVAGSGHLCCARPRSRRLPAKRRSRQRGAGGRTGVGRNMAAASLCGRFGRRIGVADGPQTAGIRPGRTVAWAIFVFLFGLPGLVGYLVHRRWPFRAACPACHRLVPRDRSSCAACRAEFPTPQPKGIEVLVPSS